MSESQVLYIRVSAELHARLKAYAEARSLTLTAAAKTLLYDALANQPAPPEGGAPR